MSNTKTSTYVDPHDLTDGCVKLLRVVEVDGDDVRSAYMLLGVWMLGGHLREAEMDFIQNHNSTSDPPLNGF